MAYVLVIESSKDGKYVKIGNDNGMKGGQNYERRFEIQTYQGKTLLIEKKSSPHCADFSRVFEIVGNMPTPIIKEYWNEDGENASNKWTH